MNYKAVLFDLDGTLTDPKIGITRSVQYALSKMGILESDLDKLEPFIGPPLAESFAKHYLFDAEKTQQAIDYYREYFRDKGMFENQLYPGIPELLEQLKRQEKILILATSKPTVFAERILRYFEIDQYFDLIAGSHLDGTRTSKTEIIEYILQRYPELRKQDFIMIGDREHDIIGANNTGVDSIAVAYGYGTLEELSRSNPTYLVDDVQKILQIL